MMIQIGNQKFFPQMNLLLVLISFFQSVIASVSDENAVQDHLYSTGAPCDWISSGPRNLDTADVRVGNLRCRDGKVLWKHPTGSLALHFHPAFNSDGKYQFCIRPMSGNRGYQIWHTTRLKSTPVLSPDDQSGREICMDSGPSLSLLLEASPGSVPSHMAFSGFYYVFKHLQSDVNAECRPCSDKEMVEAYCSAPIVFKGAGATKTLSDDPKYVTWQFNVQKLYRKPIKGIDLMEKNLDFRRKASLKFPSRCSSEDDAIKSTEKFLITAREELGEAIIQCVQRWQEWDDLRRKLKNSAPCDLFSKPQRT